jgi:putative peptidoglycan lipid II flippase
MTETAATPAQTGGADGGAADLGRSTLVVTAWNLVSRLTGFVRVIATASALGIAALGDTYQRTNQLSNLLFELLAGGMLFSVMVPSFVAHLHRDDRDGARRLAGVITARAGAALVALVAVGLVAGHPIMSLLTSGVDDASRAAQVRLGTFLLWFVLPQLVFYLVGSVATGLLQADHRFAATSFAPVCNNVVVTATMVAFAVVHDPHAGLALTFGEKLLLGAGTLGGVVAMTVVPFVALRVGGLGYRPRWRADGVELRPLVVRGLWGAGHVGLNEVLTLATVVLAGAVSGGVIAYQTALTFFLLPHAMLAHPIFTTIYPRLARHGAEHDAPAFATDLGNGERAMLSLVIPAAGLLAVVATPGLSLVHLGQLDAHGTRLVALVLAAYLVGLAGYSVYFLLTRASYALDDARSPTVVNGLVTAATVATMVVTSRVLDGTALLVSFGLAQAVFATAGSVALHRIIVTRLGRPVSVARGIARATAAAVVGVGAALLVSAAVGWSTRPMAVLAAGGSGAVGLVAWLAAARALRVELPGAGRLGRLLGARR